MSIWRWAVLSLVGMSAMTHAEVSIYRELDDRFWFSVAAIEFSVKEDDVSLKPVALGARVGGQVFDYMGVELRGALGLADSRSRERGEDTTLAFKTRFDYQMATFLIGILPVSQELQLRGYAGMASTRVTNTAVSCAGVVCDRDQKHHRQEKAAWGLGALWRPYQEVGLSMEMTDYGSRAGQKIRALEVGAMFFF